MKIKFNKKSITFIILLTIFLLLKLKQINFINNGFLKISYNNLDTLKFPVKIIKVIDGDTIQIEFLKNKPLNCENIETVRLIGIDTPELNLHSEKKSEFYAAEAYKFTKNELNGQYAEIQFDNISTERDKYNRLICYLWIESFLFNQILIERGYARFYNDFDFNSSKMTLFMNAELYAKKNSLGIWSNYEQ